MSSNGSRAAVVHGQGRGVLGLVERAWSGDPGTFPWTKALLPAAWVYTSAASTARARAVRSRRAYPGAYVIAVGGLTVGGAGKTSVARWLAREALSLGASPAVLLRGHGRRVAARDPYVVPDYDDYPLPAAFHRGGDEAAAHRAALPRGATVVVDRDRYRAAEAASSGYGATALVLDDGWEQSTLRWNELWVAVDPDHPLGNGSILPAGPLRRPPATLREATTLAFILEGGDEELPRGTVAWARSHAPAASILRFVRVLDGTSKVGERAVVPWRSGEGRAALVSGVGSPARLSRFARLAGVDVVSHAAFPDHARWSARALRGALQAAADKGAAVALITEKDEPRWPSRVAAPLPIRVLRTSLRPLDPVAASLEGLRSAVSARGRAERPAAEGVAHP